MLVAISGSQGSGKSTVLNELKSLGHNTIERKTSRSILSDWDVTLQEVNNNRELTLRFQDEIILRKHHDEIFAMESDEIWFTERTFADLFTYALVSLGKDNENSEWLDQYFDRCKQFQSAYSKVFYLHAGLFTVEHDGVRGSNQHYSRMVDLVMEDYTKRMTEYKKIRQIQMGDLDDRIEFIIDRTLNT